LDETFRDDIIAVYKRNDIAEWRAKWEVWSKRPRQQLWTLVKSLLRSYANGGILLAKMHSDVIDFLLDKIVVYDHDFILRCGPCLGWTCQQRVKLYTRSIIYLIDLSELVPGDFPKSDIIDLRGDVTKYRTHAHVFVTKDGHATMILNDGYPRMATHTLPYVTLTTYVPGNPLGQLKKASCVLFEPDPEGVIQPGTDGPITTHIGALSEIGDMGRLSPSKIATKGMQTVAQQLFDSLMMRVTCADDVYVWWEFMRQMVMNYKMAIQLHPVTLHVIAIHAPDLLALLSQLK